MNKTSRKYLYFVLFSGLALFLIYFLTDYFYEKLWIFYLSPLFIVGLCFLVFFILTIIKKNKIGILIGAIVLSTIFISEVLKSELFKSKKVLEAILIDDLSAIRLTLRENKTFEVVSSSVFTEEKFFGSYEILNEKIIFKNKIYSNGFIPDTVSIIGDKIVIRFDDDGNPITDFATFFQIEKNLLKNAP